MLTLLITDISISYFAITCISMYKLKCNKMDDDVINRWSQRSSSITVNIDKVIPWLSQDSSRIQLVSTQPSITLSNKSGRSESKPEQYLYTVTTSLLTQNLSLFVIIVVRSKIHGLESVICKCM